MSEQLQRPVFTSPHWCLRCRKVGFASTSPAPEFSTQFFFRSVCWMKFPNKPVDVIFPRLWLDIKRALPDQRVLVTGSAIHRVETKDIDLAVFSDDFDETFLNTFPRHMAGKPVDYFSIRSLRGLLFYDAMDCAKKVYYHTRFTKVRSVESGIEVVDLGDNGLAPDWIAHYESKLSDGHIRQV